MPAMPTVCAPLRSRRAMSATLFHHGFRPLQRRRIGQLHADDQPPLILLRNEARRRLAEHDVRQHHQHGIDQQHQPR